VLAELRLGLGVHVGKKRVARLMRLDGLTGVSHRRKRRGWNPTRRRARQALVLSTSPNTARRTGGFTSPR